VSKFTLVMPYYRNPTMLELQVKNWNSFSEKTKAALKIVLIDDCSPEPAEDIFAACTIKKSLYRIDQDIVFNAHGARNLGMKQLRDEEWALLTDMDVMVPEAAVQAILLKDFNPKHHYTMERMFEDGRPPKQHCNTILVQRRSFWRAGGYDEDFCGCYGGDGIFLRALEQTVSRQHWDDVITMGFNGTVEDCSTRGIDRKGPLKEEYIKRRDQKKQRNNMVPRNPLRFPWHQVY